MCVCCLLVTPVRGEDGHPPTGEVGGGVGRRVWKERQLWWQWEVVGSFLVVVWLWRGLLWGLLWLLRLLRVSFLLCVVGRCVAFVPRELVSVE